MRINQLGDFEEQVRAILNGGVDVVDNHRGVLIDTMVGERTVIRHELGYVPMGFLVVAKFGPGDVWATEPSEWTKTSITLQSSATSLRVRLFVM